MAQSNRWNVGAQAKALVQLPRQIFKTAISGYNAYMGKENLQVRENQKNPMYGKQRYSSDPNQHSAPRGGASGQIQ